MSSRSGGARWLSMLLFAVLAAAILAIAEPAGLVFARDLASPVAAPAAVPTAIPNPPASIKAATTGDVHAAAGAVLPITLALSPTTILAGASVTGQASWASAPAGKPTGTVVYTVYTGSGCTGAQFATAGAKTISTTGTNGSVPVSDAVSFPAAGSYSWLAAYAGDVNYAAASACTNLTVTKYSPTIALTLSPTTIAAGATSTGSSTLTTSSATAGGTVVYTVYSDNACTTALTVTGSPSTVTVTNKIAPNSAAIAFSQAGLVYWQAVYSGDAANNGATSACVTLTVNKTTPTLAGVTTPSGTMTAGATALENATLTGATSAAGGTVTYAVYTSSACTTQVTPNQTSTVTVTNGVAPASAPQLFNAAGTFYWKAVYSGDANNTTASSTCLALIVTKTSPVLTIGLLSASIVAGNTATGTAAITGETAAAAGAVTYTVYSNNLCTTTYTVTGSPSAQTLAAGVVTNSAAITFNTAGTFYWKAVYAGDAGNNTASSACITLTVTATSPTLGLTTTPAGSVVTLSTVTAAATLTGSTTIAGGTVIYTVYTDSACTTVYTATGNPSSKTVTNKVPAVSGAITISLPPGSTVYWQAVYSGDASNGGATSPCVALNVIIASPTIGLTITPAKSPMKAGGTATGKATLTGSTATAGGTVVYTAYTDSACTTIYTAASNPNTTTVTAKVPATSSAITFGAIGTFYWQAVYSGDANNNGGVSPCVALAVAQSTPTLTLTAAASKSPMKIGATAYGKITMSLSNATASGSVTYTVYTDSGCATPYSAANTPSTVTVTNHVVPNSALVTIGFVGTVYWKATYAGDVNNAAAVSTCVALVVAKATPTLTLTITPTISPMRIGGTAKGGVAMTTSVAAGGSLTYTVYSDSACTTTLTALGSPSTVTVVNNVVPASALITINTVATVYWKAAYAGDAQNAAAVSSCVSLVVAKTAPVLALTVNPTLPPMRAGGTASGSATLTGATADASGTVVYTVYTTNACTTQVSPPLTSTKTVAAAIAQSSDQFPLDRLGTSTWKSAYLGDASNGAVSSACVGLTVVSAASSSLTLSLSPNPTTVSNAVTGHTVLSGTTVTAGGTVIYTVYTNASCTTQVSPAQTSTKTVINAVPADSAAVTFNTVGTFYWSAVYSGDANNTSAASACTALPVGKATPSLSLTTSPSSVEAGNTVAGVAVLSGGANAPGGTVVYTVYANIACTTQVSPAQTSIKTVSSGTVPNSDSFLFNIAGTFYWKAVYSGDTSNAAASSACAPGVIVKSTPDLFVSQIPLPVNPGDNFTGHVTLSSDAVNPTGTSTLSYYSDPGCTAAVSGLSAYVATLSGGAIPDAPTFAFVYPDGLFLQAAYSGDANNAATTSDCFDVAIAQDLPLSVSLSPSASVSHGDSVSTQASWPIDEGPSGTMTYTAYAGAGCTGATAAGPETKTIDDSGDTVPASSLYAFPTAGTYSWQAAYPGDDAYNPTSVCVTLTVNKTTPVVSLSVSPSPIKAGQSAAATATLSASAGGISGTVVYTAYSGGGCATLLQQSTKTIASGAAPSSDLVAFSTAGASSWNAVYQGDGNNNAASSPCTGLTVNRATPTLSLTQTPAAVNIGGNFNVHLALSVDAANPTGTAVLTRYTDNACANQAASPAPFTTSLSGGQIPNPPAVNFNFGGPLYQQATYSGDGNNAPASTGCLIVAVSPGTLTASLTGASLTPVAYSNSPSSSSGVLTVTISDVRGTWAGWHVTITSSDFVYGGTSPRGANILATGFAVTSAGPPSLVSGQGVGAGGPSVSGAAVGSLDQTRALASASPGYGSGTYSVPVAVSLAIPAQSQSGGYTAAVTVAISTGP